MDIILVFYNILVSRDNIRTVPDHYSRFDLRASIVLVRNCVNGGGHASEGNFPISADTTFACTYRNIRVNSSLVRVAVDTFAALASFSLAGSAACASGNSSTCNLHGTITGIGHTIATVAAVIAAAAFYFAAVDIYFTITDVLDTAATFSARFSKTSVAAADFAAYDDHITIASIFDAGSAVTVLATAAAFHFAALNGNRTIAFVLNAGRAGLPFTAVSTDD